MKLLATLLAFGLSLGLVTVTTSAHAFEAGKDYVVLTPTQPTSVKLGQVEVLEFFWYRCPHCFNLEPDLNQWAKKQPRHIVLKRVPAILNENWSVLARAYYALEAIGLADKLHAEVFHAIHIQGMDLTAPETFFDWAVTKGADRNQLVTAYNSFSVDTQVMRAQQLTRNYKLNGVPAIAINGKFVTSAYMTGGHAELFKTVDTLIAQEVKRK
jgi:protein dithiol oxidoreductase (disulfide-forming)